MKYLILTYTFLFLGACGTVVKNDDKPSEQSVVEADKNFNEAQKAYSKANAAMHKGMGVIDKDADVAFIQGMIPHHQGAVDMANIILEHGDDEEAKELARNVIKAQEAEIAWMINWLKERNLSLPDDASHEGNH